MTMNRSQSTSENSGQPRPDFPKGLRVLVVDDDPTELNAVSQMLKECQYNVTACLQPKKALDILREKNGEFDIVLCDVYMPDMNGFQLLEYIKLEMSIPVIMMSAEDDNDLVIKVLKYGACDHLTKPVSLGATKTIWRHLIKRSNEWQDMDNSTSMVVGDKQKINPLENGNNASLENEGNCATVKRGREPEEVDESLCPGKKPRVVWTSELHEKFVAVVEQLGVERVVPKKILEMMDEPDLTRENVSSHLQKYRLHLKRSNESQHQGRSDAATVLDAPFNQMNNFHRYGILAALGAPAQRPPQALVNVPGMAATNYVDSSTAAQRVVFNSEAQPIQRPTMVQQGNINQMNMFQPRGNISQQIGAGAQGFVRLPSSLRTIFSIPDGSMNDIFIRPMNQRDRPAPLESNMGKPLGDHDWRFNYGQFPRPLLHPSIQNDITNESNCLPHVNGSTELSAFDDITNLKEDKDVIPEAYLS